MPQHPHFNDGGAIDWFTDFSAGLAAAKGAGKRVFIEVGRKA